MQEVTPQDFEQVVLESPVPVLVDFYADWCPPCRAATPHIEELAKKFDGKALVVKFNVDKGSEVAMKYGVRGIPNFTIFVAGEIAKQSTGFSDEVVANLTAALEEVTEPSKES